MHTTYVHNGFLVLAFVFFLFNGFRFAFAAPRTTPNWDSLGYASVVVAFLFPFFI
jgi:hypothetical protein